MKLFFKSLLFAALAAGCVPAAAFAAPENHEEFARQYMPESQAIFERFRKDCAETRKLRDELAADLRVMNRELGDDAGYCALTEKIAELDRRESTWATMLKDAFFKHKAAMITAEKLAADDAALAKKSLAWENGELKTMVKNSVAMFGAPAMAKIPGKPYAFGKYEITQKQYQAVMDRTPSYFGGRNLPVERVSWEDAVEFCKKLTMRERVLGRISENQAYRLPTEKEWEHACRAGTTGKTYHVEALRRTSSSRGHSGINSDLEREGWYAGNSDNRTHPVGQKEPNAFGLYDMCGNVWEWTSHKNVARGGAANSELGDCGTSGTYVSMSDDREKRSFLGFRDNLEKGEFLGFRVVLDPATSEK